MTANTINADTAAAAARKGFSIASRLVAQWHDRALNAPGILPDVAQAAFLHEFAKGTGSRVRFETERHYRAWLRRASVRIEARLRKRANAHDDITALVPTVEEAQAQQRADAGRAEAQEGLRWLLCVAKNLALDIDMPDQYAAFVAAAARDLAQDLQMIAWGDPEDPRRADLSNYARTVAGLCPEADAWQTEGTRRHRGRRIFHGIALAYMGRDLPTGAHAHVRDGYDYANHWNVDL